MSPFVSAALRLLLLDRLVERWNCLRHEGAPRFNCKEDALEPGIVLIFVITFAVETDGNFYVDRHELGRHVSLLSVMHFEILKSQKLLLFRICNFQ